MILFIFWVLFYWVYIRFYHFKNQNYHYKSQNIFLCMFMLVVFIPGCPVNAIQDDRRHIRHCSDPSTWLCITARTVFDNNVARHRTFLNHQRNKDDILAEHVQYFYTTLSTIVEGKAVEDLHYGMFFEGLMIF